MTFKSLSPASLLAAALVLVPTSNTALKLEKFVLPLLTMPVFADSLFPADASKPPIENGQSKGPNKLLFSRADHLIVIDPDGKNEKKLSREKPELRPSAARLSPDGKMIAMRYFTGTPERRWTLHVRGIDDKAPGTDLGAECDNFAWSPDGAEIAYSLDSADEEKYSVTHGIVTVKTKEKRSLKLPESQSIIDWSGDGKLFLTGSIDFVNPKKWSQNVWKLHLMNRDGTENKALTDGKRPALYGKLSPDGKRVLYMEAEAFDDPPYTAQRGMKLMDVASGKAIPVADVPLNAVVHAYCWSPDSKRIAYSWSVAWEGKLGDRINQKTETFLIVCDADGKNAKTILTENGTFQIGVELDLIHIDWR